MGALVPHVQRPVTQRLRFGPFRGMRTAAEETADRPDLLHYAVNLTCTDPAHGGAMVVRPPLVPTSGVSGGFGKFFHVLDTATAVLPVMLDQTLQLFVLSGPTTWNLVVSSADFAAAGIVRDPAAPVYYAVSFTNKMIVSDGVNPPWTWDGTPGSGGLATLTNCPPLYGQITEYAGKLFGIKAADHQTIVWSEENDPATGYQAGGFDNAWTISQQGQSPLVRLHGRNDALYYWRTQGFGAIAGAVTSEFRTTHTHDAISASVGLAGPGAVADSGDALWWYSQNQRVYCYPIGGVPTDISPEINAQHDEDLVPEATPTWRRTNVTDIATARAVLIGPNDVNDRAQVWFSLPGFADIGFQSTDSLVLVYDADTRLPLSWYASPGQTLGDSPRAFVHLTAFRSADGSHGTFAVSVSQAINQPVFWHWQTSNQTGLERGLPVVGLAIGPVAGADPGAEQAWLACDVVCRLPASNNGGTGQIGLTLLSPAVVAPPTLTAFVGDPVGSALTPQDLSPYSQRVPFGLDTVARSVRPMFTLRWSTVVNFGDLQGFGLERYALTATAPNGDPNAA